MDQAELDFISQYLRDLNADAVGSLEEYQARWPERADAIESAYTRLQAEQPAGDDPDEGGEFGPYSDLQEIGRGGQGIVYKAEDTRLGRTVALKVLKNLGPGSEHLVKRFKREAEVAAKLNHPGICGVLDAGVISGTPFIAMQYVEGESLSTRISTAKAADASDISTHMKLSLDESPAPDVSVASDESSSSSSGPSDRPGIMRVLHLIEKAARALHAAHEAGVVHRDVKPGNMMITEEGEPIILDFGLARAEESDLQTLTRTGELFGTPAYMSPEQLTRQTIRLDRRTDVYSLGVTLFECLTCERPFRGATREALYKEILFNTVPDIRSLNESISDDIKVIVETVLEKHPDQRYQTALALAEDLRRVRELEPIHARPITGWIKVKRWAQRNPVVAASLLVAMLSLSGGLVASVVLLRQTQEERDAKDIERKRAQTEKANVLRLSAFQTLKDLEKRAENELWPLDPKKIPLYEEWLNDAQKLVAGLEPPGHYEHLQKLRKRVLPTKSEETETGDRWRRRFEALPQGELRFYAPSKEGEGKSERPAFRRFLDVELRLLEEKLNSLLIAQAVREGKQEAVTWSLDERALAADGLTLNSGAWQMVNPERRVFGLEARGLAYAQRALQLAEGGMNHVFGNTLAWALIANGLDKDAVSASKAAFAAAPEQGKDEYESYLNRLQNVAASHSREADAMEISLLSNKITELKGLVSTGRTFDFELDGDRWWHSQLLKLITSLEGFQNEKTGLMGGGVSPKFGWGVARRLAHLREITQRLLSDGKLWDGSIARVQANPIYKKLRIDLQFDLVPLGPDPFSGLEEFCDLATGEIPKRDTTTKKLLLTERTGLVFVLLPAGTFWMGAQNKDPEGRNYDPEADASDGPVQELALSAFFLSKYEMTKGQWERLAGSNPSISIVNMQVEGGKRVTLQNPVEDVSWLQCERELSRIGLALPTAAQWEYGCRGGTNSPWWTGKEREKLLGAANLLDKTAIEAGGRYLEFKDWQGVDDLIEDAYVIHAPVGSFRANGFGFHHVHGNVAEWCQDRLWNQEGVEARPRFGDGLRGLEPFPNSRGLASIADIRVIRGGSFMSSARQARTACHTGYPQELSREDVGVRPARGITTR